MASLDLATIRSSLKRRSRRLRLALSPHHQTFMTVILSVTVAIAMALAASQYSPGDRIVIGNTGGTLTSIIELDESRVLIGAGPSRSHAADLIGRTTRPWDRDIDMLVIPGWDDQHIAGSLGLLERRTIRGIAVIGLPGEATSWTRLEREAESQGIAIRHFDQPARLEINDVSSLEFSTVPTNGGGAWVRLIHHGKQLDLVDATDPSSARPDPRVLEPGGQHVIVNMRSHDVPEHASPELAILPAPHWQSDFGGTTTPVSA